MDIWVKFLQPLRRSSTDLDSLPFSSCHLSALPVPAPKSQLNSSSFDFLKSKSEVVAALASLLSDNNLQINLSQFPFDALLTKFPTLLHFLESQRGPLLPHCVKDFSISQPFLEALSASKMSPHVKRMLFSSSIKQPFSNFVFSFVDKLLAKQSWEEALRLLNSLSLASFDQPALWNLLRDHILCCLVKSSPFVEVGDQSSYVPSLIAQISDISLRQRLALSCIQQWEVNDAIVILRLCLSVDHNDTLSHLIRTRLQHMLVYQQVKAFIKMF
jgi:hypothetical protein